MDNMPFGSGGQANSPTKSLEEFLELYLVKKAPFALPVGVKETIVKLAPWLTVIGIVFSLPFILLALGISTVGFGLSALGSDFGYYAQLLLVGVGIVLEVLAVPGLFKRAAGAWRLAFYAILLSLLNSLVGGHILNTIIGGVIGLYVLFQVKEYYK